MSKSKARTWARIAAGFYKRIGSDGVTPLATVNRDDDGTWAYMVTPFGNPGLGWQVTGHRTMAEAKRLAEAGYRSYMHKHATRNS